MNPFENLMPANNVGNAFMGAFQQGQQQQQEAATQNALAKFAQNPNDPEAMSEVMRRNPELGIRLRGQQQQQHAQALEAHRDNIIKGAQIFRQLGVKDEATYQQALAMGRQIGIDLSEVPPNFDPQYVNGVVALADTFAPQQRNNGQIVPFTPGGGVARFNPQTNQVEVLVAPNDGSHAPGAPINMANLGPPAPQGVTFTPIDGGPTPPASGGFPESPGAWKY